MVQIAYWTTTYWCCISHSHCYPWSRKVPPNHLRPKFPNQIYSTGAEFSEPHHYIGIITVGLSLIQPIIGYLADKLWNPQRKFIPIWPDKIHWWFGHVIIAMATASVITGMILLKIKTVFIIIFSVWIGINVVIYMFGYFWREIAVNKRQSWIGRKGGKLFHLLDDNNNIEDDDNVNDKRKSVPL